MTSKDKETKSFQDKLKQFFRLSKNNLANIKGPNEFSLTEEIERELSKSTPVATRTKTLRNLKDALFQYKLEPKAVEKLWMLLQDLFGKEHSVETRHTCICFFQWLLKGQFSQLNIMRAQFFRIIKEHDNSEDVALMFELFQALTDNGKVILYFEQEVGPFLLNWLPEIIKARKEEEFLSLLTNVIKFNAAHVDEPIVSGLVQSITILCCDTPHQTVVIAGLQVLDTIVAYSNLPPDTLSHFIGLLCRTVTSEHYCSLSWKVIRNLLGTHMGHSALYTMCSILQEPGLQQDSNLLRGAIFFIKMGLWSPQYLTNLRAPPNSILPSILCAAKTNHPSVLYEIMLCIQQLIQKLGLELYNPAWDTILTILSLVIKQIFSAKELTTNVLSLTHLHETLTLIENLIESGKFLGSIEHFHKVVEECAPSRPEASVVQLISYLARDIVPTRHLWFNSLNNLLQKYYKEEKRTNIRLKVLSILERIVTLHRNEYEDELIDRIVVPHLVSVVHDPDITIRAAAADLLVNVSLYCESKKCLELLDILEKLLFRPFDLGMDSSLSISEQIDLKTVVTGLTKVFLVKLFRLPSLYAIRIYKMLIAFLEHHYAKPKVLEDCAIVRFKIFECLLKLRADNSYRLGCVMSEKQTRYSPFLSVIYRSIDRGPLGSPPPMSPVICQQPACTITYIPAFRAFKLIITSLKQEKDWDVLQLILQGIPQILQNKCLILTKHGNNEIGMLIEALAGILTDKSLPESLKAPIKPNRPEFHIIILMAMASLSSYHQYLDHLQQQKIVRCLVRFGLIPKNSKQCVAALTLCALEMREVMVKMLPEVLLDLSKISATVHIAIPVLEFLSTLAKLSSVYASFVGDQYMAVFAISLPFTNPFKFNHYIVSLAHHVIAVWFLKCRLPFRRDFISYITKGLQTNILVPFEELPLMRSEANENSADRKRSSSLSEGCSRGRGSRSSAVRGDLRPALDNRSVNSKTLAHFYEELTETCIDLMARYTFSSYNDVPRRSATAEFILNGGNSMTWLLGTKLITVTTSGCSQKALKYGLCEKCWISCRLSNFDDDKREESNSNRITRQNSAEKSNTNTSASSPMDENKKFSDKLDQLSSKLQQLKSTDGRKSAGKQLCVCWCQGWAEIYVRRPTGDMAWTMRTQNSQPHHQHLFDFPLGEISTLFAPIRRRGDTLDPEDNQERHESFESGSKEEMSSATSIPISIHGTPSSRQSSRDSMDDDFEIGLEEENGKSRNPVRRSNSSPEMSASWKNPFMQKQEHDDGNRANDEDSTKKNKNYSKDMRVSCEAIPEEIGGTGTTPPSTNILATRNEKLQSQHPTLLTYHSCPGSTQYSEHASGSAKTSKTVPASPNIIQTTTPLVLTLKKKPEDKTNDSGLPNLAPLSSKPPQSPPQTSPRLVRRIVSKEGHEIQKSSSLNLERTYSLNRKEKKPSLEKLSAQDFSQRRDRCNTISIMTPAQNSRHSTFSNSNRQHDFPRSANNPSFVFLQLYHSAQFGYCGEKPLRISSSQGIQRSLRVLDCIPPYETHRIGIIYVGESQCKDEAAILRNSYGSMRYIQFLQDLGTLIKLQDVDPQVCFLGGLDQNGEDGKFTYVWQDDVIKVVFHIATLMPYRDSDPNCNNKKKHIGNNNVTIVYNESGEDYDLNTITGQFNYACVIIHPLDHNTNKIVMKVKDELRDLIGDTDQKIVTDQNVALLARQLALHADLGSLVSRSLKTQSQNPYASNWLERLRRIKNIRTKIFQESNTTEQQIGPTEIGPSRKIEDFSEYT